MTAAIEFSNVSKRFDDLKALDKVSFSVQEGEFFALLGPNGAGKSTLINILSGLAKAHSGEVRILGHDVVDEFKMARRSLGVVPQEIVFDPFFTVREMLRLQSGYFGLGPENDDWIEELMVTLNLEDKADVNMRKLSGGMKRRVMIAQALVHKPPVVVLDEPTAGVDVELRRSLWDFVRTLHKRGHTIVLTTHYLEEAESLCGRIAILNKGRLVALEKTQTLIARGLEQNQEITVLTSQTDPQLPQALEKYLIAKDHRELRFRLNREDDSIARLLSMLEAANIDVLEVNSNRPDLEDVFVSLTSQK